MRAVSSIRRHFSADRGRSLRRLCADIKAHGVHNPIAIHEGKILEGRNRARAAEKVGRDVPVFDFDGDDEAALAFVISQNVHRRHLTVGQRAFIGVALKAQFAIEADARKKAGKASPDSGRRSDAQAAAMLGIGKDAVRIAETLLKHAPDLVDFIQSNSMSLNEADETFRCRKSSENEKKRKSEFGARFANSEFGARFADKKNKREAEKIERKVQSQDDQVKQFLVAIKAFDEAIKEATIAKRKFAPEGVRFTKRKLETLMEHIETLIGVLESKGET